MTPKEQAIAMLSQGVPATDVARIAGVTPSAISQWQAEASEQINAALAAQSAAKPQDVAFDSKLDAAEDMALSRIEKGLPFANMGQALAAFRILNAARRRRDAQLPTLAQQSLTLNVNLTLPANALPQFTLNKQSEIVEVDGRTLVTTDATQLDKLLAARSNAKLQAPALTNGAEARVLQQAAQRLDGIVIHAERPAPRRSPLPLSADML
jgi:hypothetical protein